MFEGNQIVKRSMVEALTKLKSGASYFVGLNSISGISEIIRRGLDEFATTNCNTHISTNSLGFIELPLLLYNDVWGNNKDLLLKQFDLWRKTQGSFYQVTDGMVAWVYDVIEFKKHC